MTLLLAALLAASGVPGEVVVYLGNAPAPSGEAERQLRQLAAWLDATGSAEDAVLAEGIRADLDDFPRAVAADVEALTRLGPSRAGVVLATNAQLKRGAVSVARRGGAFVEVPLELPPARDLREATSPLARAEVVRRVLELVAAHFPPAEHQLILAVHSHGDEAYALTPRVGLPFEGLTRERLLARVHGDEPTPAERLGVTTKALLGLLAEARARRGQAVALLVLATCEGTLDALPPEVPRALVAAGGGQLPFGAVDYGAVLAATAPSLVEAFVTTLTPAPLELAEADPLVPPRWSRALRRLLRASPWFLPVGLWLAVFVWRRRVARGRSEGRSEG